MPVHYFVCNQRDKYDGIDVWSCVVPAANGNQKDRLKHFLRQMPQVSCPDLKGNETNEKVKNYPMNKRFVMVDLDEKTKQAAEHELSHTEAKIKIRSLYQDQDQRQLEELGWEMGLVPLGKSPEHIFVELSKMCSEIPEAILHTTTNEVAIMDRYIRKAEYLKHNDEVILKKIRDVWNYTYEPNSSFARSIIRTNKCKLQSLKTTQSSKLVTIVNFSLTPVFLLMVLMRLGCRKMTV